MKMQITCSAVPPSTFRSPRFIPAVESLEQLGFQACKDVGLNANSVIEINDTTAFIVFGSEDTSPDRRQSGALNKALEKHAATQQDELVSFAIDHSDYLGLGEGVVCYKFEVRKPDYFAEHTLSRYQVRDASSLSPAQTLAALESTDADVRFELASRMDTDQNTLDRLVQDADPAVRGAVAANPNVSQPALEALAVGRDPRLAKIALDKLTERRAAAGATVLWQGYVQSSQESSGQQ